MSLQPEYVLHQMSLDEFDLIYREWEELYRDNWERTRLQCFYSVAPYSKEKNIKSFMPLDWDKKTPTKDVPKSTREEFEKIKELLETTIK